MKIVVAASVLQGREAFSTLGRVTVPVSYTHLDVYKRQACIRSW